MKWSIGHILKITFMMVLTIIILKRKVTVLADKSAYYRMFAGLRPACYQRLGRCIPGALIVRTSKTMGGQWPLTTMATGQ